MKTQITISEIKKYLSKKGFVVSRKSQITILEIKKYLSKKGFVISRKKHEKSGSNLGVLARTFLSSLIIISFFSITPLVIDFTKKQIVFSKDFENKSKDNLKKLLDNQNSNLDDD